MGSGISLCKSSNNVYPRPEAVTEYGKICGKHFVLKDGRVTDVFLGIPFAKPPVGELRFEKPQPPEPWTKIKTTIKYQSRPIQQDYFWDRLQSGKSKSEDCLYLNIMTPNWSPPSSKGFPVMFYIHGGGYSVDSAAKLPYESICNNMVSNDIVFVTIEYRLGFLGFFTTDDEIATGNYGIWDMQMAFLFVKNNITNFKGDAKNITVIGHSAGAAAADLLSLSPLTRDLFDKMILMSGNAETIWSISPRPHVAQSCRKKAEELGFQKSSDGEKWTKEDNIALLAFFKSLKASKLATTMLFRKYLVEPMQLQITPIIDGDFFPKTLNELRDEAPKKHIIVGETEFESLAFFATGQAKINKKLLTFFCDRTRTTLQQIDKITDKSKQLLLTYEKWEQLYGITNGTVRSKNELKETATKINSDIINTIPLYNFIQKSLQQRSTVYAYNFTHFNKQSMSGINFFMPKIGSTHGCDLLHLLDFNYFFVSFSRSEEDLKVTKTMSTLFSNFAKCGSPNFDETNPFSISHDLHWDPIKLENPINCLKISAEPKMEEVEKLKRCIPQSEAYAKLHEWLTVMDENVYNEFKANVKHENE